MKTALPPRRRAAAFTMVEIALCLAIIGFALVAIIGVLPTGLQVQKGNRDDTIINQEGIYYLEAIRNGSTGLVQMVNFVDEIKISGLEKSGKPISTNLTGPFAPRTIVGLLSVPKNTLRFGMLVTDVTAKIRPLSGGIAEKGATTNARDFAFSYLLQSEIVPYRTFLTNSVLSNQLYEARITLRWPARGRPGNWLPGGNQQVFRTLIHGKYSMDTTNGLFFIRPAYARKS